MEFLKRRQENNKRTRETESGLINMSNEISHVIDIINEITEDSVQQQERIIKAIRNDPEGELEEKEFNQTEFMWDLRAYIDF